MELTPIPESGSLRLAHLSYMCNRNGETMKAVGMWAGRLTGLI